MDEKEKWITKGLFLGGIFFLAIVLVKPIEISTQFSVLSGIIYQTVDPTIIWEDQQRESGYRSSNAYYDKNEGELGERIENPWNYDFIFVLAIPFGAFVAYIIPSKQPRSSARVPKRQVTYEEEFIEITRVRWKRLRRVLNPFLTGVLLLYGARLADGCTSGHIMSGIMQGSVSGYIFTAIVFAVSIPVAIVSGYQKNT